MTAWPTDIPWLENGFEIQRQDNVIRTPMSAGPAKSRPRFSAVARSVTGTTLMSNTQRAAFEAFYDSDLAGGSLTFTKEDPRIDDGATWRFTAPPRMQALHSGPDGVVKLWRVYFNLEILP